MTQTSLKHDTRGATAIEYAIIAALIGVGLIASLVSTRGSLSAIFGTAGSQMTSGTSSSAAPAEDLTTPTFASRKAYWDAKTLTGKTVNGQATYTYSDGSSVRFAPPSGGSDGPVYVYDPVTKTMSSAYLLTNGTMTVGQINQYTDATFQTSESFIRSYTFTGVPPVPTAVTPYTRVDGTYVAGVDRAPTAAETVSLQKSYYDNLYFQTIWGK